MDIPEYISAHKHSSRHSEELLASEKCGCFYCLSIFSPDKIAVWIDKGDTAMCPKCSIDSVIGSKSGFPISESFLQKMYDHWFDIHE